MVNRSHAKHRNTWLLHLLQGAVTKALSGCYPCSLVGVKCSAGALTAVHAGTCAQVTCKADVAKSLSAAMLLRREMNGIDKMSSHGQEPIDRGP